MPFSQCCGVSAPGQVLLYVHTQKTEVQEPLPTFLVDDKGLNVHFVPPVVLYQLLGFSGPGLFSFEIKLKKRHCSIDETILLCFVESHLH